jgi:hypothetical protein
MYKDCFSDKNILAVNKEISGIFILIFKNNFHNNPIAIIHSRHTARFIFIGLLFLDFIKTKSFFIL